jgi:hypothetical protein
LSALIGILTINDADAGTMFLADLPANPKRTKIGQSILFEVTPPTGKPDAGNPPVRFGGRGGSTQ